MSVSSPYIVYVGSTAFDLRKVSSVIEPSDQPSSVIVRFIDEAKTTITLDRTSFEAAWQAALNASSPGTAVLGGDLGGTVSSGYVNLVRGVSSSITYDGQGRVSVITTAFGTKTLAYNGDGTLASITGTGNYHNKAFSYAGGILRSVTVS